MKVSDICGEVYKLEDIEDLRIVNQTVTRRWRELQTRKAVVAQSQFRVGDKVRWAGRRGSETGTILRFGPKNVIVKADNGVEWRITPTLLSKAS